MKTISRLLFAITLVILLCSVQRASATIRTFQFSGLTISPIGAIAGKTLVATVVFDDASAATVVGSGYSIYNFISFVITGDGNTYTASSGSITVENTTGFGAHSQFDVATNDGFLQLSLTNPGAEVFPNTNLPSTINLSDFPSNDEYAGVITNGATYQYYAPITSFTQIIPPSTTTSISSNNNPSFTSGANSSVTFTATVTSTSTVNEGTVSFTSNGVTIPGGGAVAVSNGQATLTTTITSEGSFNISANYNGTANFATGSGSLSQTVNNHTTVSGNSFCNSASGITASTIGVASPYPSEIFVSGLSGTISGLTVSINGFQSGKPSSVELLLVGPGNQTLVLLTGYGGTGANPYTIGNIVFSDAAAAIPTTLTGGGTYKPTAVDPGSLNAPAPAGPYNLPAPGGSATLASVYGGISPNGTWKLYEYDTYVSTSPTLISGWCLNFTTVNSAATISANAGTTPQSTGVSAAFTNPLAATVTDASSNPVSGVSVIFSAPSTGATGTFSNGTNTITVSTDANGNANAGSFTANATAGSYSVRAMVASTTLTANFSLTNNITCPSTYTLSATTASTSATTGIWTAPPTGGPYLIKITAAGAQGGSAGSVPGGKGATMQGTFVVNAGQTLNITAGSPGGSPGAQEFNNGQFYSTGGGGGGGSGVYTGTSSNPTALIIAGGGGGSNFAATGLGGNTSTCGGGGTACSGGGGASFKYNGSGGGGLMAQGIDVSGDPGGRGVSGLGGAGASYSGSIGAGGSGGGGTGGGGSGGGSLTGNSFNGGGGGGGGYSGGDGGGANAGGGGGGSINNGTNQNNQAGANAAGGYVTVECLGTAGPTSSLLSINGPSGICQGTSTNLVVTITGGTSPYTVVYQDDNVIPNQFTVTNYTNDDNIPVSPTNNTTYSLVSVTDANSAAGTGNSGTATITVNPLPTISNVSRTTTCSGSAATLTASSTASSPGFIWSTSSIGGTVVSTDASYTTDVLNANTTFNVSVTDGATHCTSTLTPVTVTVNPTPNAVATPSAQTICSGSSITTVALTGDVTGTAFNWTRDNAATVTGIASSGSGDISGLLTNATTSPVTVTFTIMPTANDCPGAAITATVIVNPLPTGTISGTTSVCLTAAQPNITFTGSGGTAPYTFTYSLFDGTNTATGLTTSGSPTALVPVPTGSIGTYTYTLVSVQDGNTNACPQTITGQTAAVTVNPLPAATISGTTAVCLNAQQPGLTFTGSGGTAPYTFSYSISDGTTTTTGTASGSPSESVAVPTGTAGTFTYTLTGVHDASSTACAQIITGQSAVVTVNPLPDAGIITSSQVTAVSTGNTASVADAGIGATYSWTVTNGSLTGGNGTKSITYKASISGVITISVSVTNGNSCGPVTGTQLVTITAQPCPNPAITVASAVCTSSTGNIASVASAGADAVYVWTVTNGTITGGNGTNSIIYKSGVGDSHPDYDADDSLKISVKVTNGSGVCTVSSGTYRVFISPLPTASIAASTSVCASSTGNIASVPTCGTGATYVWTITNGTITAGGGTSKITYTAGASGSVTLTVTATNTTGCKASGNKVVSIAAYPVATITAASSVCAGSNNNTASVASGGTGAKYSWTITNGVITAGSGTSTLSWSACASGSVTLSVKVTNSGGCSASSGNKVVTIIAAPNAVITASSSVCAGSTNAASVASGANGYAWTITNGAIIGSTTSSGVSYKAGTSGTVKLTVTVANSTGCKASGSKSVTIVAAPNGTISSVSSVCSGSTGNAASVSSAGSGATYTWTITNGTITSGSGTASIKYTAVASGSVTLNVTVKNSTGCVSSGSKVVSINAKITPAFTQIAPLCLNAKAPILPTTSNNGIPGTWNPSKITTSSTGTKTYTFTPASGQCTLSATMNIAVQKCNSLSIVSPGQPQIQAVLLEAKINPNPSETEFTLTLSGNSNKPVEIRVVDMYGRSIHHARGSANQSYKFGGQFTSGVYIVEILQDKLVKTLKIIKAK